MTEFPQVTLMIWNCMHFWHVLSEIVQQFEWFLDSTSFMWTMEVEKFIDTWRNGVMYWKLTMFILPWILSEVPEKIQELHYLAEAMRDLASKPGGASVSFDEWKNFALKMKEELKILGIQATAELKWFWVISKNHCWVSCLQLPSTWCPHVSPHLFTVFQPRRQKDAPWVSQEWTAHRIFHKSPAGGGAVKVSG